MRCLVVLPTYNERENAVPLAREILALVPAADGTVGAAGSSGAAAAVDARASAGSPCVEVLVVDDNSPDGTGASVRAEIEAGETRLHLLERAGKLGLGTAYLAGFRAALDGGFDAVVTMDCDFSHHPRFLPDLLAGMAEHDLMIGSRYVPGGGIANWPLHRRFLSGFANVYTRALLRLPVRDCTSGFRCYRTDVVRAIDPFDSTASGYSFLEEMCWRAHRAGFRIGETPILFEDRVRGQSKINRSEIWRAAWHVLRTAMRGRPTKRS